MSHQDKPNTGHHHHHHRHHSGTNNGARGSIRKSEPTGKADLLHDGGAHNGVEGGAGDTGNGFLDSSDSSIECDAARKHIKIRQKVILSIGIVVGVFGASLLALLCILYVRPYLTTSHLQPSQCVVSNETVLIPDLLQCHCDDSDTGCTSKYPCLQIMVNYKTKANVLRQNLLYDNLDTYQLYKNSVSELCSFHICHAKSIENVHRVQSYHSRYGVIGHRTTCYCDPVSSYCLANVVSRFKLIHVLLWPCVCVLLGVLVLAVYVMDVTLCCARSTTSSSWSWCHRLPTSRPFNSLDRPWLKRTRPLLYEPVTI